MTATIMEEIKMFRRYQALFLDEDGIRNSLTQQVMSTFRPKRFPIFLSDEWFKFTPITQLEKIIYRNLAKHRKDKITKEEFDKLPPLFKPDGSDSVAAKGTESIKFKRG